MRLRQFVHCLSALQSTLSFSWLPEDETFGSHLFLAWQDVYGTKSSDPQVFENKFITYVTKAKE